MTTVEWSGKAFAMFAQQMAFLPPAQRRQLFGFLMEAPPKVKVEAAKYLLTEEWIE